MNFLMAIIDSVAGFVRRNPFTTFIILFLAIAAPAVLKGIALFILYFVMGLILLILVLTLAFRWRIYRARKQMEEQFGRSGFDPRRGGPGSPFSERAPRGEGREGEVKIYKTRDVPEKRVSDKVGDYVEFEEEKD
ncbi:DUF4834 domain-containing protein [Alistipes sp.]|uniref:DUF4834 domain-containing protein n=1 Tax=Alistipes sp. TaxID=1872444 RepID=UPI003A87075A